MVIGSPGPQRCSQSPAQSAQAFQADVSAVGVEVVVSLQVHKGSSSQGDVGLDLLPRPVHIFWHAGHLEHGVFLSTGRHNVGVSLLLDALDGCSLWANDKTNHSVGHPHLDQ